MLAALLPSARCAEPPAEPGVSFSDQLGGEAPDCGDQELLTRVLAYHLTQSASEKEGLVDRRRKDQRRAHHKFKILPTGGSGILN